MRLCCFILMFFVGAVAGAETWTNAVGHAIEAELVSRNGDQLTLKKPDGQAFKIHYKALSKESRDAVDKQFPVKKQTHAEIVKQRTEQRLRQLESQK